MGQKLGNYKTSPHNEKKSNPVSEGVNEKSAVWNIDCTFRMSSCYTLHLLRDQIDLAQNIYVPQFSFFRNYISTNKVKSKTKETKFGKLDPM